MDEEISEKIQTQSMQIPKPLKKELDNFKVIPRESYPSVIQWMVDELHKRKIKRVILDGRKEK